jgi:hypothetical protein
MDYDFEEHYDFDPKERMARGEMPSILSSHYNMLFNFCQRRARALTRIAQGWPRKRDEEAVKIIDGWLADRGLTPRQFGFVDPPKLVEGDVISPNTGKLFAALGAPSVN